ncbi:MAG: isoamylase [Pirellulaceae bacterium]|jgi:glycogen operon protein|nr:isoamylase [Pirellulaceae bacterium]
MGVRYTNNWFSVEGEAFPLGATWIAAEHAFNFALYSKHATAVTLLLFHPRDVSRPVVTKPLNHLLHKSGRVWHCRMAKEDMRGARYYAYQIDGPQAGGPLAWHAFDPDKVLLDPYAKSVHFPVTFERRAAIGSGSNLGRAPLGVLYEDEPPFDWGDDSAPFHQHDLVIYEMHVRGFTRRANSGVPPEHRGTFRGVIEKIPYLQELGITAVELLPVHQFDPQEGNYWGYMTLNFFAPHHAYASAYHTAHDEFREMVRALHDAGIEVLLDVVFNHTAEGDHRGPCYSYKGIDNSTYYMLGASPQHPYRNYSGTGNTLHCANRYVARMILDSLRHWVVQGHVDGFRFDLASVFARQTDGSVIPGDAWIVSAIRSDPILGRVRLIAEPWDAAGLNQLGTEFPGKRWFQWNGRFRDDVRRFVKGDAGLVGSIMRRIYGSDELFPDDVLHACHPYQSVNYVNSHDGFTLYDQVSYNERHNWANGHGNTDGHLENYSWNCGWEGDVNVPASVVALRRQQAKNLCCLLMMANGTPMFAAGDEFLHTQRGNNNPYNQDNATTWLDWSRLDDNRDIFRFFRLMIALRKSHPSIARSRFWRDDVRWYGTGPAVDLAYESRRLAYCLHGTSQRDVDFYVMINAHWEDARFAIQEFRPGMWKRVVDTAARSPFDICAPGDEIPVRESTYQVRGRSIVVLMGERGATPPGAAVRGQ